MTNPATLTEFTLTGVHTVSEKLGYGTVDPDMELSYQGLKCAGKKLLPVPESGIGHSIQWHLEECQLHSQIRHPNIVEFLGFFFEEDSQRIPILVTEFLPTSLTKCLDEYGILPDEISYSILDDVSLGLSYLHGQTPPIMHRDLCGNSILLTYNMTAKISDFGLAKTAHYYASEMTFAPGTVAFMPPEAMVADPQYDTSIDVFSFGVLMIQTLTAEWPLPSVGHSIIDPTNPDELIALTEVERYEEFLRKLAQDNPLMDLIKKCLNNNPKRRPQAQQLVSQIGDVVLQYPSSFENRVEMLRQISTLNTEKTELEQENNTLRTENERLRKEKTQRMKESENTIESIKLASSAKLAALCETKDSLIQELAEEVEQLQDTILAKNEPIKAQSYSHKDLMGIDIVSDIVITVTKDDKEFHWKDNGFKMSIPQGSLPAGVHSCSLHIFLSLSGQYSFSDNHKLASAVYWIYCNPPCRFKKPITIVVQHCATKEAIRNLSFVRALCSQVDLPYRFKKLDAGSFSTTSTCGSIQLHSFSGIAISHESSVDPPDSSVDSIRKSAITLYYLKHVISSWKIYLIVTWDLEAHINCVKKEYHSSLGAKKGASLSAAEIEGDKIEVDIPMDGTHVGEWILRPLVHPSLTKAQVEYYEPGKQIPSIQIKAKLQQQSTSATELFYHLTLKGVKRPNIITIDIEPEQTTDHDPEEQRLTTNVHVEDFLAQQGLVNAEVNKECSDEHILSIYPSLLNWERVAFHLGLKQADVQAIKYDAHHDTKLMRLYMLKKWKSQGIIKGNGTYRVLIKALLECGCTEQEILDL